MGLRKEGIFMPTGVYVRTPEMRRQMKKNLAKGRLPAARKKAAKKLRKLGQSEEWRDKVSEATKRAMHRPEVRTKHLKGLKRARQKYGVNFKGGNGQEPVEFVKQLIPEMLKKGFIHEYPVPTAGHRTGLSCPSCYKVDFGHPGKKRAYEIDGPSHNRGNKHKDQKKEKILKALGWKIKRITHK
jgi:very-short-patch-repair endonuclease